MKYFLYCLKHYADFNGRARRSEFWYFQLFHFLFTMGVAIFLSILSEAFHAPVLMQFICIWLFILLIPSLAVAARRLHDSNLSAWFLFWGGITIVGGIILLFLYCSDSEPGVNKYGSNPKGIRNKQQQLGNS